MRNNMKTRAKTAPVSAPAVETTTIILPRGVELVMVPIPGKDYLMGKFTVTQAQWEAVMGRRNRFFFEKGAEIPADRICMKDCQKFLAKLNALPAAKKSGVFFRLPTDDEWEFACHAGATNGYCKLADGTEITKDTLTEVAWFFTRGTNGAKHPVGQKKPNAFGLHDMLGNVWEWTSSMNKKRVWGGKEFVWRDFAILRGGSSLCYTAEDCTAQRHYPVHFAFDEFGFRLCAVRLDRPSSPANPWDPHEVSD